MSYSTCSDAVCFFFSRISFQSPSFPSPESLSSRPSPPSPNPFLSFCQLPCFPHLSERISSFFLGTSEENTATASSSSKKAKRLKENAAETDGAGDGSRLHTRTPLLTMAGHNEGVSSLEWMEEKKVASASWDHTIKLWDIETAREEKLIQGN